MKNKTQAPPVKQRDFLSRFISAGFAAFWLMLIFSASSAQAAQTPAGTQISNSAAATYLDGAGVSRSVTSNTVVTIVQQVASVTLVQNLAKTVAPGTAVTYPVTLTNTGNGPDSFLLTSSASGTLNFGATIVFYADLNGDGVADNNTPITTTPVLAAGDVFNFVISATAPIGALSGQTNTLVATGTSNFAPAVTAIVTDTTTVTNNAVINTTKAMSAITGAPGSGPYTVTLSYTNTGNSAATAVNLSDVLPAGMTYVAGTGRWSVTGALVLTDATGDNQGTSPTINYSRSGQTVTAIVSSVAPGQTGTVTFNVSIVTPFAAGDIANTATTAYNDGAANIPAVNTNTVLFTVTDTPALTFVGSTVASAAQGSVVSFSNVVTNNGNSIDTFDITVPTNAFPAGSSYVLYQPGGLVPLTDTNSNGIPDTGPVAVGATYTVVARVTLATGGTGGPFTLTKKATSANNPAISATATDTLTVIATNSVDLTNNSAGAGAPGAGVGPEAGAITTNNALPGTTTVFSLFANNTGPTTDTYDLTASTDSTFTALTLPTGWTVVYHTGSATGPAITNTGPIASGASLNVFAEVSIPAGQAAIPTPGQAIYFRVLSPTSGALDRKHDAVIITTTRSLALIAPNTGQVAPGSSVVYTQNLTNTGNVSEAIALTFSTTAPGFTVAVFIDANGNGIIDPSELAINTLDAVADVTLASGASQQLLVKVTAAGGLAPGTLDTTTLTATSTSGVVNGLAAPTPVSVVDTTTVVDGSIVLLKGQAVDALCDGTADTAFTTATLSTGATPGACIIYRVTATNSGNTNVTNLVITDNTPVFTKYSALPVAATVPASTVTNPGAGVAGAISANVGTLTPSANVVLTFGVKID